MDPKDYIDFLNLLQYGQRAMGQSGQFYNGVARDLGNQIGQSGEEASKLLNSGLNAADRQASSAMSAYSDSDASAKLNSIAKMFKIDPAKTGAKFKSFLGEQMPNIEDMGNRANAAVGVGDLAQRSAVIQLAQGDPRDPLVQFARYLAYGEQPPAPTEKL
jgi:hypothetical protein